MMIDKVFCSACNVELRGRIELIVKHMITEHGITRLYDLNKMCVRFGEPEWDRNGKQIAYPVVKTLLQVAIDEDYPNLILPFERAKWIVQKQKLARFRTGLEILAGIPDEDGKTYGSILHGHEVAFALAVLDGKTAEEALAAITKE